MANDKWQMANGKRWEWAALVAILLAAAFLRLYRLDAVPPGLTHDEAGHVHDATAIVGGARPIYQTVGYGREPLYDYLGAGLIALGVPAVHALRLLSVTASLITLLVTFLWVRQAFDGPTALLAVALQAASFWSLAVSRQALRSSLLLALFTAALYLYPFFDVCDWVPQTTRQALLDRAQGVPRDLALPVDLDGVLLLRGYDLRTPAVAPGEIVELITVWEVTDPTRVQPQDLSNAEHDLVFFTHALDAAGMIAGQDDRLDGPVWSWQSGDMVAQIHRFTLPEHTTPGTLDLVVGVYRRSDMTRLPVRIDGTVMGDLIRLATLEVRAP